MNEHLPLGTIEQILDLYMPSFSAICTRCPDGTLTFQFQSRAGLDGFAIVGVPKANCRTPLQVELLAKQFREDFAVATGSDSGNGVTNLRRTDD
ncbi:MAG: hypothetical protein ABWY06_23670 [Pseudomonas sp.]|uniref:hypothetical protein n=1 Tax=Pseudomonas sp. TaxID=306 RepID=UPI003393ECDD